MTYPEYLDFDLELAQDAAGYLARVLGSPRGEAEARITLPFDDDRLENVVLKLGRTRSGVRRLGSPQQTLAKAFGASLYEAVFVGEVGTCFRRSLDEADRQGKGLRLRLHLGDAPALSNVPWEYLYPEGVGHFLVLSMQTPLVRYLDLPREVSPLAVEPPLRILLVVSGPSDLALLDADLEVTNLRDALAELIERGLVQLDVLPTPTLSALRRALRTSTFHVLHFIGHGGYDEANTDGVLAFEDETGRSHQVSGGDLGTMLHDHKTLRLAVLNACEGARTSPQDPFSGVAQSLVQQGLPAVVAMQFEVTDAAAIALSHEFYTALSDGYPVDAALTEGRKAVFGNDNDVEWGTPVLYLRAKDGRIFDVTPTTFIPRIIPAPQVTSEPAEPRPPAAIVPRVEALVGPGEVAETDTHAPPPDQSEESAEVGPRVAAVARADRPATAPVTPAAAPLGESWFRPVPSVAAAPPQPTRPSPIPPAPPRGGQAGWGAAGSKPKPRGGVPVALGVVLIVAFGVLAALLLILALVGGGSDGLARDGVTPSDEASPAEGGDPGAPADFQASGGTAIIDGDLSEWSGQVTATSNFPVSGPDTGIVGLWQVMWDDDALYLLVFVNDQQIVQVNEREPSAMWNGDGVSLELGKDAGGRDPGLNARSLDAHFIFGVTQDARVINCVNRSGDSSGFPGGETDSDIAAWVGPTDGGYVLEAAIPWSTTAVIPAPGVVASVNFNVSDADPLTGRLASMMSSNPLRSAENQQHPGLWQRLFLG